MNARKEEPIDFFFLLTKESALRLVKSERAKLFELNESLVAWKSEGIGKTTTFPSFYIENFLCDISLHTQTSFESQINYLVKVIPYKAQSSLNYLCFLNLLIALLAPPGFAPDRFEFQFDYLVSSQVYRLSYNYAIALF